jgi:hypothetical protein
MKIRPLRAELFHADRRTEGWTVGRADLTKIIVAVRNIRLIFGLSNVDM